MCDAYYGWSLTGNTNNTGYVTSWPPHTQHNAAAGDACGCAAAAALLMHAAAGKARWSGSGARLVGLGARPTTTRRRTLVSDSLVNEIGDFHGYGYGAGEQAECGLDR